jgi:hypothetical protein
MQKRCCLSNFSNLTKIKVTMTQDLNQFILQGELAQLAWEQRVSEQQASEQ